MISYLGKRILLLVVLCVGVLMVLARATNNGALSDYEFKIAIAAVAAVMVLGNFVLIVITAKRYKQLLVLGGGVSEVKPADDSRLTQIRLAEFCIIVLVVLLFWGLSHIQRETILGTLFGAAVNVWITALLIRWVIRRKKSMG